MLSVIMLSVIMLSVIMLNVFMLSVIMLNVVMLSVVAPFQLHLAIVASISKSPPGENDQSKTLMGSAN
jgi:hypothetical protein